MMEARRKESPKAEFFPDMPIDEYHGFAKDMILSKTMIKELVRPAGCPAMFRHIYLDGGQKEESKAMGIGKAVHTLALEPSLFEKSYYILPEGVRRDARAASYKEHLDAAGEREIIREQDLKNIEGMANALVKNDWALALLKAPGIVEGSIFWTCPDTGLKLRCRPDFMRNDGLIVDLKTTGSVRPDLFRKTAFDLCYDVSVALTARGYEALHGKRPDNYVFLAIETSAPYLIGAFDTFRALPMERSWLDGGEYRLAQALMLYRDCLKSGFWPGYSQKIDPMEYPAYAAKLFEEETVE